MSSKDLISLEQAKKNKNIKNIIDIYNFAIEMIRANPNLLEVKKDQTRGIGKNKPEDSGNVEYELPAAMVMRNYLHDREFPLESVMLSSTETRHQEEIGKVKLHIGAYADEYARSMHAMAFTIGATIFFRNGAYKPESEEGRALLAHELKHVSQNKEYMTADNRTKEELEAEAVQAEELERYNPDSYVYESIGGKTYRMRKSQQAKLNYLVEKGLEEWVEGQERSMSSADYLKLLLNYKDYLEGRL